MWIGRRGRRRLWALRCSWFVLSCYLFIIMNNLSIVIDTAEPATPRELGERLGVSVVQVVKTLVRNGVFLRLDETMDATTVLTVAAQLGFVVQNGAVYHPTPRGIDPKANWLTFRANMECRNLNELYHFTAVENVPGIITAGAVLSRRQMGRRGVESVRNTWGSAEKERVLGADYICLSITNQWPMLTKKMWERPRPPAVLVIEPRVVWYQGTCFSPTNSASKEIVVSQLLTWSDVAHFDALFPDPEANWPNDVQAEVLVRDHIPLVDIKKFVFYSQDTFDSARSLCGLDWSDPVIRKFTISKRYYPNLELLYEVDTP